MLFFCYYLLESWQSELYLCAVHEFQKSFESMASCGLSSVPPLVLFSFSHISLFAALIAPYSLVSRSICCSLACSDHSQARQSSRVIIGKAGNWPYTTSYAAFFFLCWCTTLLLSVVLQGSLHNSQRGLYRTIELTRRMHHFVSSLLRQSRYITYSPLAED